jgi:hypothetical protein
MSNKYRIAIRIPETFYVLRENESLKPERFSEEAELIDRHQSNEVTEELVSEIVQLGRKQIDNLCKISKSKLTTATKNISEFKSYIHKLESDTHKNAILEVKFFLKEMRDIEHNVKGENIYKFLRKHWSQYSKDFYFILKSIDLTGIRIVRDSSLLEKLSDEEKINIFLESF